MKKTLRSLAVAPAQPRVQRARRRRGAWERVALVVAFACTVLFVASGVHHHAADPLARVDCAVCHVVSHEAGDPSSDMRIVEPESSVVDIGFAIPLPPSVGPVFRSDRARAPPLGRPV